jgi:AcrR family transcriptional regulator
VADRTLSRRERKAQARRAAILEAAADVFAAKGFARATTKEIAARADVAEGTIYNYFSNKRELMVAMAQHVIGDSVGLALEEFQAQDDRSYLTALLRERFDFQQRNLGFVRALMTEVWTNEEFRQQYLAQVISPLIHLMEGYLQRRVEAGTARPLNTSVVVRAMAGSFLTFLLLSEPGQDSPDSQVPYEELVDELVDFFLLGLQARPA